MSLRVTKNKVRYVRRFPVDITRGKCEEFCQQVKKYAAEISSDAVLLTDPHFTNYYSYCTIQWIFGKNRPPKWAPDVLVSISERAMDEIKIRLLEKSIEKSINFIETTLANVNGGAVKA